MGHVGLVQALAPPSPVADPPLASSFCIGVGQPIRVAQEMPWAADKPISHY